MNIIKFSLSLQIYTQGGSVESDCNGLIFINIGTDTVTVLGYPIIANATFSPPCNIGEMDITNYIAQFAGVTTNQQLLVIRKNYI
jgi:hypothetical protein